MLQATGNALGTGQVIAPECVEAFLLRHCFLGAGDPAFIFVTGKNAIFTFIRVNSVTGLAQLWEALIDLVIAAVVLSVAPLWSAWIHGLVVWRAVQHVCESIFVRVHIARIGAAILIGVNLARQGLAEGGGDKEREVDHIDFFVTAEVAGPFRLDKAGGRRGFGLIHQGDGGQCSALDVYHGGHTISGDVSGRVDAISVCVLRAHRHERGQGDDGHRAAVGRPVVHLGRVCWT